MGSPGSVVPKAIIKANTASVECSDVTSTKGNFHGFGLAGQYRLSIGFSQIQLSFAAFGSVAFQLALEAVGGPSRVH